MTLTAGNVSLLLTLLSTVAPGTWALVAGVGGIAIGFFGKQLLKKHDCASCASNSKPPSEIPRSNPSRRTANPRKRKKNPAASGD
jgi:hypothetical protein